MSTRDFWDKMADRFVRGEIKDKESYEKKLSITQQYFSNDMHVMEVGCGSGMTAIYHAPHVKHIHATDISPVMIEIAKENAQKAAVSNMSFECSDVASLTVDDASQDAVLAMSILHLLKDPSAGMLVLHSKLKPGGLFVSSTICLGDEMNFLKPILPIMRLFNYAPSVVHFFRKETLLESIEAAGFSIEYEWQPSPKKAAFVIARKV